MQVPLSHQMVWPQMVTSGEHYVTAPPQGVVISQPLPQDPLVQVPIVLKNSWFVPGIPPQPPHPSYLPQPLQYVTVQPRVLESGGVETHLPPPEHLLAARPLMVAHGAGRGSDVMMCGRSLRGSSFAARRRSEEIFDETPTKKASVETAISCHKEAANRKDRNDYILQSVEYYFSDENLSKNAYLLKQILQENGYISLKRITALKRVKLFSRDDQVVAQCIRRSKKLEMNEDGTMVRRKDPLPSNIEPPRFVRSVIAINLPMAAPSIEAVTSLFAVYGDLTQVRILKPGKKLPPYLTDYLAWIPDLGKKLCALVEFESQDEAQTACREINIKNRSNESLRVALLKPGARLRRTLYRKYKGKEDSLENPALLGEKSSLKIDPIPDPADDCDASCLGSEPEINLQTNKGVSIPGITRCASDSGYSPSSEESGNNIYSTESEFGSGLFVPCFDSNLQVSSFSCNELSPHLARRDCPNVTSGDRKSIYTVPERS